MHPIPRLLVLLFLALTTLAARAENYIADSAGCKVWNPYPRENERVTWSGACQDGFAQGPGTVQWSLGDAPNGTSTGSFVAGRRTGKGIETFQNGDRYEGDYADGRRTGKGTFVWHNGDRYEGDFIDGKRTGQGMVSLANGMSYQGDWLNNLYDGKGTLTWPNGDRYEGDFVAGQISGKGTVIRADGARWSGDFANGKPLSPMLGVVTAGKALPDSAKSSPEFKAWSAEVSKKILANYEQGPALYREDAAAGGILTASIDAAGQVGDWSIKKTSGWSAFDERMLKSARDGLPFPAAPVTNLVVDVPFQYEAAVEPTRASFSLKTEVTGSHIARKEISNISVPPEKTYADLTEAEKNLVKSNYEPMAQDDEPPYPVHGTIGILKAVSQIQNRLGVQGSLKMYVNINDKGEATSVDVLSSPDTEMTKSTAAILMVQKYKPAICGGTPCTMQFPFRMNFTTSR